MPSNARFYSSNVERTARETKEYPTKKFESIVSIWCAVSNNGVNRVYVAETKNATSLFSSLISHRVLIQCGGRDNCVLRRDLA